MTLEMIRNMLGWCTLINFGILLLWFFMVMAMKPLVFGIHTKWFKITEEQLNLINYGAMALFKMLIFVFCLVPYLALRIVG